MKHVSIKCRYGYMILCFLLAAQPLCADQVIFKNGRTLDCSIIVEAPDHVEVSLGAGSMNIPRSQIKQIVRSETSTDEPQTNRSGGNILFEQNAPKAYAELAADFRVLMKQRNEAMDARYMMDLHDREIAKLEADIKRIADEINGLTRQLTVNSEKIAAIKLPDKPPQSISGIRAYNQLIAQKQKLVDEGNVIFARLGPLRDQYVEAADRMVEIRKKYKTVVQPIMVYKSTLQGFLNDYAEQKKTIPNQPDEPTAQLFTTIDRYLARFTQEMSTYSVDAKQVGDSTIVRALLNGSTVGEFVFDTGASTMTISESLAKKLGMRTASLPTHEMVVADGSVVQVKVSHLKSVAVGHAEAANVEVAILPDSPNNPVDGLLGMSFLKHFIVGINGTTGEIELTKLKADATD